MTSDKPAIYPTITVRLDALQKNPWNPNVVDPINQEKIKQSMLREGVFRPLVVRELDDGTLEIIGGEHRVDAAKELGIEDMPAINLGKIDDAKAKRITLLDNGRYGDEDPQKMRALLEDDIGSAEDLLAILPIDETELTSYFEHEMSDFDIDAELGDDQDDDELDLDIKDSPTKSHDILRFKVTVEDAETLREKINAICEEQGFTESDKLTNAGDALVWLATQTK